ncbi:MAG: alpha-ketoacid dehydrogenase subunit beta, partial [Bdellovibrionales bacterium]|nr:alpha-ketoacid dehydrogenase subunit beta [Bdellovibrionales bacterium]
LPIVFRGPSGAVMQLAAQHSQSFESFYGHIPGLKVVMPSTPYDAKGLLKSAIRDDNPVVFMESEAMYGKRGPVPEGEYLLPLGKADVKRAGSDLTLICWSKSVPLALEVADALAEDGVRAEVIDMRTIRPLDFETLEASLKKTNRAVVVQESWPQASIGHWIAAELQQRLFDYLDAPIYVVSGKDSSYPYARSLEALMPPSVQDVLTTVARVL